MRQPILAASALTCGLVLGSAPSAPVAGQVVDTIAVDSLGFAADSFGLGAGGIGTLTPEVVGHLEAITTSFFGTPLSMGLLPTGMVEAAIAAEYVSIAGSDSLDVGRMAGSMVHVMHAIDPGLTGGGAGLGYGFRQAAEGVRTYAELAAAEPGASDVLLYHAPFVVAAASGAVARANEAVAVARSISVSSDPEAIRPALDRLARLVRDMAYGFDADRDGRIGNTPAEAGLAQAAYHLALVRRVEGLAPAPPLPEGLPVPASLVIPGYRRGNTPGISR